MSATFFGFLPLSCPFHLASIPGFFGQPGKFKESMLWLEQAIDLAGKKDVRLQALEDPDLEPLWTQIGEI